MTGMPTGRHTDRPKGEVMGIHSKFLVHWTGAKDIEKGPDADKSQRYVERLKDDLQKGLFTRRTDEDVIRKMRIKRIIRICFTESV